MNPTTKPYWKDECNHPPGSYVGSFEQGDAKCDVYRCPNQTCAGFGVCVRSGPNVNDKFWAGDEGYVLGDGWHGALTVRAAEVLRAHRAQAQAAPAPTTRAETIEKAARVAFERNNTRKWADLPADCPLRADRLADAEAVCLAIGRIDPLPKPAPAKSPGAEVAERIVTVVDDGFFGIRIGAWKHLTSASNKEWAEGERAVIAGEIAAAIDAALAAQATAHAAALAGLRDAVLAPFCRGSHTHTLVSEAFDKAAVPAATEPRKAQP